MAALSLSLESFVCLHTELERFLTAVLMVELAGNPVPSPGLYGGLCSMSR